MPFSSVPVYQTTTHHRTTADDDGQSEWGKLSSLASAVTLREASDEVREWSCGSETG
jgi:hypothetical protein